MSKPALCAWILALALLTPLAARADAKPINLSLFTPIQIFPASASIHGFRFTLFYAVNHEMHGFDFGLVNRATGSVMGFQWGLVNVGESLMEGVQFGFVNYLGGDDSGGTGLQWGFVNYSPRFSGVQLGFVNITDELHGMQLGVINIAKNGFLPVFVLFNSNFD
ncbi:MAG TPA: hypothetical protein VJV78_13630 [Polyangiales bacterium]|nr:hypothetical protein [Polyangiales bacterium]